MADSTNRFAHRSLAALYTACQTRAGTLMGRGTPRTPKQREDLAIDTAYLLLAIAARIQSGESVPGTPEKMMQGSQSASLVGAFGSYYRREAREARYRTLKRAENYVLGERADQWDRDALVDGVRVSELALDSDGGLRRVLETLEEILAQRR